MLVALQATHRTEKGDGHPYPAQLKAASSKRRKEWLSYRARGHTLNVRGHGERGEGGERRKEKEEEQTEE